uniref:NADH-ubiquinone oxidoreductase chain 6 n=1 Tax=Clostera anastomosis TaxID=300245 RepID=A0A481P848_9NEOP|nr:NADH dehydrogenase subunit 6 [Clostera anastomosis]QAV59273.1 NADH dehydrogenase subunit 6 [Clostera anastomosis]
MKIMLSLYMMFLSFFMMFMQNPLSMGLMILLQTMLTCLLTGMLIKTYWFSYILFLTFLGGLLVLFIYVSSIASNELFSFSMNLKLILIFSFILNLTMQFMFLNNLTWMNLSFNSDMIDLLNSYFNMNNINNKINLNKMYNNKTFLIMMMLIIYLFITLIAVVKITNIFYGPIRSSI